MSRRMAVFLCATAALLVVAIRTDALPLLRGPAPWPPEWQWGFDPKPLAAGRLAPALLCGLGLLGLLGATSRAAAARSPRARFFVLLAGILLGWGLQLGLLHLERDGAAAELTRRTESGSFTSYYTVAVRGPGRDPADFLARHDQVLPGLRKGTPHAATHPPGPVLYFSALAALHATSPALQPLVTVPLLGGALLGLLGAAAAFPVAALGRRLTGDAAAGVRLGLLWVLVPGVVLMVPQFDQALALPVAGSVAALAAAVGLGEQERASSTLRDGAAAMAAGACGGLAFFFSYGALTFVAIGGVAVLAASVRGAPRRAAAARVAALGLFSAVLVTLVPVLWGYAPWRSLPIALAIHREQFTAPRAYLTWLLFNPWDVALFLGLPVALLGLARLRDGFFAAGAGLDQPFRRGVAAGLLALLVSGTLRGEGGRVLVPLMPVLLVAALARGTAQPQPSSRDAVLVGALLLGLDVALRASWQLP